MINTEEVPMAEVLALWLPILVSAVVVFVASSVIHMAPLWHKNDFPKVPNEDRVRDALRPLAIPPGEYMIPRAHGSQEMRAPEFQEKMKQGPVMLLTVLPNGPMSMTGNLVQWFIYTLLVGVFAAYVTAHSLTPDADYLSVFRISGCVAFIGYTVAIWQMSIWYKRSWGLALTSTIDGLIYGLLTGGTFGWLWPG
jgi:hypothetical protein